MEERYMTEEQLVDQYGYLLPGAGTELLIDVMKRNGIKIEKCREIFVIQKNRKGFY